MKRIKHFAMGLLFICVAMFFHMDTQAGATIATEKDTLVTFPIEVTENYDKMMDMFRLINAERISRGLEPYVMDAKLTEYAMQRGAEMGVWLSHSQPSLGIGEVPTPGEIIAAGSTVPEVPFKQWMGSSMHIGSIVGKNYKYIGIGCTYYTETDWVVLVDDEPHATDAENENIRTTGSETVTRTFGLNISHQDRFPTEFYRPKSALYYGNMNDTYPIRIKDPVYGSLGYAPPASMLEFEVDDPGIFTVDPKTGYLKPHKVGTANLTVTLKGHPEVSSTFEVAVKRNTQSCEIIRTPDGGEVNMWGGSSYSTPYTGEAIEPKLTIIDCYGNTLKEGMDYVLVYSENVNVGTAKISIYSKGGYGTAEGALQQYVYFRITETPDDDSGGEGNTAESETSETLHNGSESGNDTGTNPPDSNNNDGRNNTGSGSGGARPVNVVEGKTYMAGNYYYKVTSRSKRTVSVTGLRKADVKRINIYNMITLGGEKYKVTSIAPAAFRGNTKTTSVSIGTYVTSIGKNAFSGCKNLKAVTIKGKGLKSIGKGAFKGISKKAVVKVPKTKYAAYKKLLAKKGLPGKARIKK